MLEILRTLETIQAHAIPTAVTQRLTETWPQRFVMATRDTSFHLGAWAAAHGHKVAFDATPGGLVRRAYGTRDDVHWTVWGGHEQLEWKGQRFDALTLHVPGGMQTETWAWIIGPTQPLCFELFGEVVYWNDHVHGEVLVFNAGCFSKDEELQKAIEATSFSDLVLPTDLAHALRADIQQFLASKDLYAEAGAVWKRGLLMLGPPGNGKTHAIKALIKESKLPCIYVKSFTNRYNHPSGTIPQAFERAREIAPCVLVMEDLDSLVDDTNRSFLLNEMDGFETNQGIVTVASTNHPERLDPSLLHRPSRFDRKYRFELPDAALRGQYLERWAKRMPQPVAPEALAQAADHTDGFTFAYLKEVGLSTQMQWITEGRRRAVPDVLLSVIDGLRKEIAALATPRAPVAPQTVDDETNFLKAMAEHLSKR